MSGAMERRDAAFYAGREARLQFLLSARCAL
jgi:hypothetical protein